MDLLRPWFFASGTCVVVLVITGRAITRTVTASSFPAVMAILVVGLVTGLAAAIAHRAPERRSLRRFLLATVPVPALLVLANVVSASAAGAAESAVAAAWLLPSAGAAVGVWLGSAAVHPRPARDVHWRPLRTARARRERSYR
jgi:hypothetical protein